MGSGRSFHPGTACTAEGATLYDVRTVPSDRYCNRSGHAGGAALSIEFDSNQPDSADAFTGRMFE